MKGKKNRERKKNRESLQPMRGHRRLLAFLALRVLRNLSLFAILFHDFFCEDVISKSNNVRFTDKPSILRIRILASADLPLI